MRLPDLLLAGDPRLSSFVDRSCNVRGARTVGWREWAELPDLGIARIRAKIDTGARSSALHADAISFFNRDGREFVRFHITGEDGDLRHEAPLAERRVVKSSNGESEERPVIVTPMRLAGRRWEIELTLTNREAMVLPMLVGRRAMARRLLVDPARSWIWSRPGRAVGGDDPAG